MGEGSLKDHESNIWACINRIKVDQNDEPSFLNTDRTVNETRAFQSVKEDRITSNMFWQDRPIRSETHVVLPLEKVLKYENDVISEYTSMSKQTS